MGRNWAPVLLLLAAAPVPAAAQKVAVTPPRTSYFAGSSIRDADWAKTPAEAATIRARFQFHAVDENAGTQPAAWDWRVVDRDGKALAPADGGTITADGIYTPPAISLVKDRVVRIEARPSADLTRSGQALVVIKRNPALTKALGLLWLGERVEGLATLPGKQPCAVAHVPRLPLEDKSELKDRWLVAGGDSAHLVAPDGGVTRFAQAGPLLTLAPRFTLLAARPWDGTGDLGWAGFLWDAVHECVWRLDSKGSLEVHAGGPVPPGAGDGKRWNLESKAGLEETLANVRAMVADRQGNLYLAGDNLQSQVQVHRINPDRTVTTLAGGENKAGFEAELGPDGKLAARFSQDRGAARFFRPVGLALDEPGRILYLADRAFPGRAYLRAIPLGQGPVVTQVLDLGGYKGDLRQLAWHRGVLLLAGSGPGALFAIDPGSGRCARVFEDAFQVPGEGPEDLREGPCHREGDGPDRSQCASLGRGFQSFAVDGRDHIAFTNRGQIGLLRLDWKDPHSLLALAGETKDAGAGESMDPGATAGKGSGSTDGEDSGTAEGGSRAGGAGAGAGTPGAERKVPKAKDMDGQ
jgi:hypothetical protein